MENDQSSPEKRPGLGWGLGKKVVVAGAAITSAPLVVPPLLLLSAFGLACAVPLGVFLAAITATERVMSSLFPLRSPLVREDGMETSEVEGFEDVAEEEEYVGTNLSMERASIVEDDDGEVIVMTREPESEEAKLGGEIESNSVGTEGEDMVQETEVGPVILRSVKMLPAKKENSTGDVDMYNKEKEQGGLSAEATEVKIEESIVHVEPVVISEKDIVINPSDAVHAPEGENDNTEDDEAVEEEKSSLTPLESATATELPAVADADETGLANEDEAGDEEKKQEPVKVKVEARPVESEYASFAVKCPKNIHDELLEEKKPTKNGKEEDVLGAIVPGAGCRTAPAVAEPLVHLAPTEHATAFEPSSLSREHASIFKNSAGQIQGQNQAGLGREEGNEIEGIDAVGSKTEKQLPVANNVNQERDIEPSALSSVCASVTEDQLPETADIESRLFREHKPTMLLFGTESSEEDQGFHSEVAEQGSSGAKVEESKLHIESVVIKEKDIGTDPSDAVILSIEEINKIEDADVINKENSSVTPLASAAAIELPTFLNADDGLLMDNEAGIKEKKQENMKKNIEAEPLESENIQMNNEKGEDVLGDIAPESGTAPAGSEPLMHVVPTKPTTALEPSSLSMEHASIVENADRETTVMRKDPESEETGLGREVDIGEEEKNDKHLDAVVSESKNLLLASDNVDGEHKVKASTLSSDYASVTEDLPETADIESGLFKELAPTMLPAEIEPSAKDECFDCVEKEQGGVSALPTTTDFEGPMLHAQPDVMMEENIKMEPSDFDYALPMEKEDKAEGDNVVEEETSVEKDKDEEITSNEGLEKIRAPFCVPVTPMALGESAVATEISTPENVYDSTLATSENADGKTIVAIEDLEPKEIELTKENETRGGKDDDDIDATNPKGEKSLQVALPVDPESEIECLSSDYVSAMEDQSSETADTDGRLSVDLGPGILTVEAVTLTKDEVLHSEDKVWEQIYALRTIMGYNATLHMSCMEELRALYLFAGVQPSFSVNNPSDLIEINHMLQFLKSIIGVK